jgi:hypothetical protein
MISSLEGEDNTGPLQPRKATLVGSANPRPPLDDSAPGRTRKPRVEDSQSRARPASRANAEADDAGRELYCGECAAVANLLFGRWWV